MKADSNGSTYISHVFLHEDTNTDFHPGVKTSRTDVVKLLKALKSIKTIMWNYHIGRWDMGANVGYITVGGVEYLRSHEDRTINDNLDNIIKMDDLYLIGRLIDQRKLFDQNLSECLANISPKILENKKGS